MKGALGVSSPEIFQIWRLRNAIFSTCHETCLRKIDLEFENGKQLQVTIIKITESKENKSIHRLEVSGSTGLAEQLLPSPLPPRLLRLCMRTIYLKLLYVLSIKTLCLITSYSCVSGLNGVVRIAAFFSFLLHCNEGETGNNKKRRH